jgi:predicted transcriptional regulator
MSAETHTTLEIMKSAYPTDKVEEVARLFEAVSSPIRIRILKIVEENPGINCFRICELMGASSSNIVHHINKLRLYHILTFKKNKTSLQFNLSPFAKFVLKFCEDRNL